MYWSGQVRSEKPYYAHSARVAGWSQVLDRWEKPGAFAVSDSVNKCRGSVCKIVEELCNKSIVLIVVK
jgi:hypothetical protein